MRITYTAFDGTVFNTEVECLEHENPLNPLTHRKIMIQQHAESIIGFCKSMEYCEQCPFLDEITGDCKFSACSPLDWEVD